MPTAQTPVVEEGPIFVLGAPRSGTTWLAKILDAHPDVLYRHEPDIVRRPPASIPGVVEPEDVPRHLDAARHYFRSLVGVRTVKTIGTLPIFPKRYDLPFGRAARLATVGALKVASRVPGLKAVARSLSVPEFADLRRAGIRPVIKSVSELGRTALLAAAVPEARFVLIIRHPCGQVASALRGQELAKFEDEKSAQSAPPVRDPARFGLDLAAFSSLSTAERLAWNWRIANTLAMEALAGNPRAMILRYEDLCSDPIGKTREVLRFLDLSWEAQVERFLAASTTHRGAERYFAIYRNTAGAAERWRERLPASVQQAILAVARPSLPGALFATA